MSASPLIVRLVPVLNFGGVESRVLLQARMARDHGMRMRVCTFYDGGAAARAIRAEGVAVDVLGTPARLGSPRATMALARYLRARRPALVHSSIVEANVHLCLAAPLAGWPPFVVEEVGQPSHGLKARALLRVLYRLPARIVGVSQVTCDYLIAGDGAPKDRVELIYNCAHPRYFPEVRNSVERPGRTTTRFLAVGRLHPIKNHVALIRAFAAVRGRGVDAELTIAGDGPLEPELRSLAWSLGVGGGVRFLGFQEDVRPLLAESDAFVLPSLSEGCSISLIEAMSTGVPAMGSDVPGIREVLGNRLARQWTFPSTDASAIAAVMETFAAMPPGERRAVARIAQERAYREFSPTKYMSRLTDLYASVLRGR